MRPREDETWEDVAERDARRADKWHDDRAERQPFQSTLNHQSPSSMGMLKDYMLRLQAAISEHTFGQDAVAWAIGSGLVPLTGHYQTDVANLVTKYDSIIDSYREARKSISPLLEVTMNFAQAAGLPVTEIAGDDIKEAA